MSQEHVEIVRSSVAGSMRGRAAVLAAALVALAWLLCVSLPVHASAATAFRQVTVRGDPELLRSDGVRFVTLRVRLGGFFVKTPWVFDTLVQRRFRATPPSPDCESGDDGGGVALWHCDNGPVLTDLATGAARELAGWAAVEAMENQSLGYHCSAGLIGRYVELAGLALELWTPGTNTATNTSTANSGCGAVASSTPIS
jgi:hypothetical protein